MSCDAIGCTNATLSRLFVFCPRHYARLKDLATTDPTIRLKTHRDPLDEAKRRRHCVAALATDEGLASELYEDPLL